MSDCAIGKGRSCAGDVFSCCVHRVMVERDDAQEAAETYHAAWQDAAVYWKAERDELRDQVARLGASEMYWEGFAKRLIRERRDLRAALEQYAQHQDECETSDWAVDMGCTCGLAEALKGGL